MFLPFKNIPGSFYYWPLFMIRNTFLLASFLFISQPLIQASLNIGFIFGFLTYCALKRPFKFKYMNIIAVIAEGVTLLQYGCTLGIVITEGSASQLHFSQLIMAFTGLSGFAFFFFCVVSVMMNMYKFAKIYQKCGKFKMSLALFHSESELKE